MGFVPVAIFRYRMAVNNAHRWLAMDEVQPDQAASPTHEPALRTQSDRGSSQAPTAPPLSTSIEQAAQPVQTVLRESFVTAGSVVAAATALVGLAEIALLVLILRV